MFKRSIFLILFSLIVFSTLSAQKGRLLIDEKFDVDKGELLFVDVSGSDIDIEAWNNDEVLVQVYGSKKDLDDYKIEIRKYSKGVKVLAESDNGLFNLFNFNNGLHFKIKIPSRFNVDAETSGGDVYLTGADGNLKLGTSGGDIDLIKNIGPLTAETSGGDILVKGHKGDCRVETSGGDIKSEDTHGDFTAETSGGDIRLFGNNGRIKAETSGGDIRVVYNGENYGINLETSGGDIDLQIGNDVDARVYLETSGGDIVLRENGNREEVEGGSIKRTINGGGNMIKCETSGGDINLIID